MSRYFCDSNSEIPFARFKDLGATLIRMPYTVNGEEHFYDLGENTDTKAFFDGMRAGAVVKTQALNSYDYMQYFEPVLAAGEDILYVTFSHAKRHVRRHANGDRRAEREVSDPHDHHRRYIRDQYGRGYGGLSCGDQT